MGTFSKDQFMRQWVSLVDPKWRKYAPLMAELATRESGRRTGPSVRNDGLNSNGTVDHGPLQVNDIWRKDPVIGPLFRSGAIYTLKGAIKAGERILATQGVEAWSTHNAATDAKYIHNPHLTNGGAIPGLGKRGGGTEPTTTTTTGFDQEGFQNAQRRSMLAGLIASHRGTDNSLFRTGLLSTQPPDRSAFVTTSTVTTPGVPRRHTTTQPKGGGLHVKGPLFELFWQGAKGIDVKNGQVVPQGFVSGHTDHVHVAAGKTTIIRLGKIAQQMGLHVGENPAFGGVHPVHVNNSFHYRKRAIDVSGDANLMAVYAHKVAQLFGVR